MLLGLIPFLIVLVAASAPAIAFASVRYVAPAGPRSQRRFNHCGQYLSIRRYGIWSGFD